MPKYAYFDSSAAEPKPVLGWYDTDALNYPKLPRKRDLYVMTDAEWNARLDHHEWAIVDHKLVDNRAAERPTTLIERAQAMLHAGLRVISHSDPDSVSGVFATDGASMGKIASVSAYIAHYGKFPGNLTSYPWKDVTGVTHTFLTPEMFHDFAKVMTDFVAQLDHVLAVGRGTLPAAEAEIK